MPPPLWSRLRVAPRPWILWTHRPALCSMLRSRPQRPRLAPRSRCRLNPPAAPTAAGRTSSKTTRTMRTTRNSRPTRTTPRKRTIQQVEPQARGRCHLLRCCFHGTRRRGVSGVAERRFLRAVQPARRPPPPVQSRTQSSRSPSTQRPLPPRWHRQQRPPPPPPPPPHAGGRGWSVHPMRGRGPRYVVVARERRSRTRWTACAGR